MYNVTTRESESGYEGDVQEQKCAAMGFQFGQWQYYVML